MATTMRRRSSIRRIIMPTHWRGRRGWYCGPIGFGRRLAAAATIWGAIEALSGRETEASDAVKAEITHRITIRHRDDVGPAKRLRFCARVFEVVSAADPEGSRRLLVCRCIERDLA